jgi:hypothetical protein
LVFVVLPFALALPPGWEPTITVMMAPSAGGTCSGCRRKRSHVRKNTQDCSSGYCRYFDTLSNKHSNKKYVNRKMLVTSRLQMLTIALLALATLKSGQFSFSFQLVSPWASRLHGS